MIFTCQGVTTAGGLVLSLSSWTPPRDVRHFLLKCGLMTQKDCLERVKVRRLGCKIHALPGGGRPEGGVDDEPLNGIIGCSHLKMNKSKNELSYPVTFKTAATFETLCPV